MPYDKFLAERIERVFQESQVFPEIIKMMGGLCYMVDDKMCCGTHFNKNTNSDIIMARIGLKAMDEALEKEGCFPWDFNNRPMKDYVYILPEGFDSDEDLDYWIRKCLEFNPEAKSSKSKKKK